MCVGLDVVVTIVCGGTNKTNATKYIGVLETRHIILYVIPWDDYAYKIKQYRNDNEHKVVKIVQDILETEYVKLAMHKSIQPVYRSDSKGWICNNDQNMFLVFFHPT